MNNKDKLEMLNNAIGVYENELFKLLLECKIDVNKLGNIYKINYIGINKFTNLVIKLKQLKKDIQIKRYSNNKL